MNSVRLYTALQRYRQKARAVKTGEHYVLSAYRMAAIRSWCWLCGWFAGVGTVVTVALIWLWTK